MATTEVRTTSTSTETLKKHLRSKSKSPRRAAGPIFDEEGNVLPYPGYTGNKRDDYGCWSSPIDRLAAAASLNKPEPFAGEYGIERSKEPQIDIPPECYLYDEERPWQLGKLNKAALDYPEPAAPIQLPKHVQDLLDVLEKAANHVFTVQKAAEENGNEASSVDTLEVYEKAKAAALAGLRTPAKQGEADVIGEDLFAASQAAKETVKKPAKPKSRNASSSPANKGGKKASTAKAPNAPASSSAPRVQAQGSSRTSTQQLKPKASGKSPGRGDGPHSKMTNTSPSPRSSTAPKKVANAK